LSFSELGVVPSVVNVLKEQGITEPFEVQAKSIPDILDGSDVCCRAPTGSGKTLAFGLPLITNCKPAHPNYPTALIVTPTRELAEQISNVLEPLAKRVKLSVLAIYGGTSYGKQRQRLGKGVDIVVATPGRLIDLMENETIHLDDVNAVVLDEADRMADMGFIDPVCHILDNCSKNRQTILFSATLDDDVATLVKKYQNRPVKIEVGPKEVSMESMKHFFWLMPNTRKSKLTSDAVKKGGRSMIFCRTRRGVDRVGKELRAEGLSVAVIHGGLSQNQRDKAMERFIYGDCLALVATDVAARGIDVEGVQCVVHYDPPENGKAYKHRSGRTARAGAYGSVISLVQKPQKSDFHKIQRQAGIKIKFTSPEFNKLPERVEYTPPKRKRKMVSPLSNKRRRGRSRFRGKPKKDREPSAQKKVEQQVERASFFRKNKNRNKFGKKNQNKSGKKRFPREEDRPRRRKKPTYGGKGLTKNEDGSPKKYGGPNKPDKKQEKSGKPHYSRGKGRSGGRSNWKRGRKSSRSNRKKFSRKK
jgi:superfamily II DNA/RNA helicase